MRMRIEIGGEPEFERMYAAEIAAIDQGKFVNSIRVVKLLKWLLEIEMLADLFLQKTAQVFDTCMRAKRAVDDGQAFVIRACLVGQRGKPAIRIQGRQILIEAGHEHATFLVGETMKEGLPRGIVGIRPERVLRQM